MGKLKLLGDVVEGGLGMMRSASKAEDAAKEVTAAERAAAGRKAAELIKSQEQVKASEALGQLREKGMKRTTTTQADRTRVGGGNIGGAPFSAISEADPLYAGKVWGVMDEGTAARLKNLTDEETAWTTMLGSEHQLKSNPIVFDKLKKGFLDSMKQGNLSPELEAKINHNLALTFGEGASIRDPKIWRQADTFEKRAALADLMMGQGITPKKGGIALGGEKSGKGVIFRPTDILKKETEPYLLHTEHGGDIPTFAAGPRLFKLEKESVYRPDLHPGFPTLITGKDLGYNVKPTPTEVYLRDWHTKFKKDNPDRKPGYYDLALGVKGEGLPSQELTDEYIRHLLREGFKKGGAVHDFDSQEASERVKARIEKYRGGGEVTHHWDEPHNVERFHRKMEMHKATGGLSLKPPTLRMAGGGMLSKGIGKLGKRLMADPAEMTASIKGGTRKFGDEAGGNTIVKDVGGNWLRDTTGSSLKTLKRKTQGGMKPEDALVQMRERFSDVPEQQQNIRSLEADVALNKWVDSNLNNYVKKQMGTPEDPVRKLAEEDITHFPIAEDPAFWERRGESSRKKLGGSKMAQSDLAQQWENRTDAMIKRDTAQEHQSMMRQAPGMYEKGDEWINKLAPETPIYSSIMNPSDLGFNHIMDVLRADLQAGRIRPEQLNKVSMEQAVRRTHEYDQEMARKMAEAQFKVTEGMPVKKEYPEGYKWVELTAPKLELEPGHVMGRPSGFPNLHAVIDEKTGQSVSIGATPEEAIKLYKREEREKNLGSALKYEGETMGHCVGSYCPDVLEGKSRIFSLRDAKGEPHVTIEVGKAQGRTNYDDMQAIYNQAQQEANEKNFATTGQFNNFYNDRVKELQFALIDKQKAELPERIVQIKGKGNAKPKDDYLPFVQDFVRGGNWSDVGDFKNTGLEWHATGPKGIFAPEDVKALETAGYKVPKYLTSAEKDDLVRKLYEAQTGKNYDTGLPKTPDVPPAEGMANGGGVLKYSTLRNRNTTQSQPNRFADGGKSEMKATPRKKGYGVASDVLKGVHEFASKPFGYENPPVELLSELLGIPAASRVLDKLSYGEPITNAGKANVPLIPDDTFDAATAGLGGLGAVSKLAKPLAKGAKYLPKNLPVGLSIQSVGDGPFGAPSIIIPSKVGNVKEAVRQSKGDYGARRVERAADEIPNLEKLYKEEALRQAFSGDNAKALMTMNPADFEKYAAKLFTLEPSQGALPQGSSDDYLNYLRKLQGFRDVPFLEINKREQGTPVVPYISGHEGRHRSRAMTKNDEQSSLVQLLPRSELREPLPRRSQEEYIEALKQELQMTDNKVKPENYTNLDSIKVITRPPIDLPDIYARGGAILKHTTLRNRRANQRVR